MNRSWVYNWNWSRRLTMVLNSRTTVCGWSSLVSHAGPLNDGSLNSFLPRIEKRHGAASGKRALLFAKLHFKGTFVRGNFF